MSQIKYLLRSPLKLLLLLLLLTASLGFFCLGAGVWAGADAIAEMVGMPSIDVVVAAMVGYAGLRPTIEAIKAGKTIALANKETLVVAGEIICELASQYHTPILPVDSEHSAIFQSIDRKRRTFPHLHARADADCDRCRCPQTPELGYGREDNNRLRQYDEQRLRGNRSQMALRCGSGADTSGRSSAVNHPLSRTIR